MKVVVDGVTYEYDPNRLLLSEAMDTQIKTGLKLQAWQRGLEEMDAFAVKALVYLLKRRAKEDPDWDALDFDLASLEIHDDESGLEAAPKGDAPAA